jgi:hypothetical protein
MTTAAHKKLAEEDDLEPADLLADRSRRRRPPAVLRRRAELGLIVLARSGTSGIGAGEPGGHGCASTSRARSCSTASPPAIGSRPEGVHGQNIVAAWVRGNRRQLVSVDRDGTGGSGGAG